MQWNGYTSNNSVRIKPEFTVKTGSVHVCLEAFILKFTTNKQ